MDAITLLTTTALPVKLAISKMVSVQGAILKPVNEGYFHPLEYVVYKHSTLVYANFKSFNRVFSNDEKEYSKDRVFYRGVVLYTLEIMDELVTPLLSSLFSAYDKEGVVLLKEEFAMMIMVAILNVSTPARVNFEDIKEEFTNEREILKEVVEVGQPLVWLIPLCFGDLEAYKNKLTDGYVTIEVKVK